MRPFLSARPPGLSGRGAGRNRVLSGGGPGKTVEESLLGLFGVRRNAQVLDRLVPVPQPSRCAPSCIDGTMDWASGDNLAYDTYITLSHALPGSQTSFPKSIFTQPCTATQATSPHVRAMPMGRA